jgi:hypothetical protein
VGMQVRVLQRFVLVFVCVAFGQMQPDACAHEGCCKAKTACDWVAQEQNRDRCPHERCRGEIRARPARSYVPQGQNRSGQPRPVGSRQGGFL